MDKSDPRIISVRLNKIDQEAIHTAAGALKSGSLIIMPTETMYGLAADPEVPGAEERIYQAKMCDRGKPIPLMASELAAIERTGGKLSPEARRLACRYWPGPLTMVLNCGSRTEEFCVPNHPVALQVLAAVGGLLRVSSANPSGEAPPLNAASAIKWFGAQVDLVLDAGPSQSRRESTVVDATEGKLKIIRQGALPATAILSRPMVLFVCTGNTCRSPMAERLLRRWLGATSKWVVASAGLSALEGQSASESAVRALEEKRLDLSSHRSSKVTAAHIDDADLIVVMTETHKRTLLNRFPRGTGRVVLLNDFSPVHLGEDVPDPFGMPLDVYRSIRDEIDAAMPDLVLHLHKMYQ